MKRMPTIADARELLDAIAGELVVIRQQQEQTVDLLRKIERHTDPPPL